MGEDTWLVCLSLAMAEIETVAISSPTTSGRSAVSKGGVKEATFYHWKYRHYFEVVDEGDKNLKARCNLCSPSSKPLSCARNTTSNFKKHLDSVHKTVNLLAILSEGVGGGKQKRPAGDIGDSSSKRQATLDRKGVSSVEVRKLVTEYIIDDMLPLTTVESPAFKKLINSFSPHPVQLPDRKTISLHVNQAYESMMKDNLAEVERVTTTADVWTAHHKNYLGMTVHWINEKSLKREKAGIACIRIFGRHTYDILAAKIEEVHRSFGLHGKISATVTDNGSNFIKAFTTFSVPDTSLDNNEEHSITFDDDMILDDDVTFTDLSDAITLYPIDSEEDDLTQIEYELPPHQRCASHTLNLVASTDVDKHLLSCSHSKSICDQICKNPKQSRKVKYSV